MADSTAALQNKKRRTVAHFKTIAELDADVDAALGRSEPEQHEREHEVSLLQEIVFEFEQHLEECASALDKYTEVVIVFNGKKQEDKDMKHEELQEIDRMEEKFRKYNKKLIQMKGRMHMLQTKLNLAVQPSKSNATPTNLEKILTELVELNKSKETNPQPIGHQSNDRANNIKLPKFELPKFNGDIMAWTEFWDVFHHSVDQSTSISKAEKMSYLKGCLVGNARDVLKGLPLDDANYDGAIKLLRERYGKEERVINAHYKALMETPAAANTTVSLRKLHTQIERHLRALEAAGEAMSQNIFVSIVMGKLPESVIFHLEIKREDQKWNVHALCKAILQYVEAKEASSTQHAVTIQSTAQADQKPSVVTTSLVLNSRSQPQHKPPRCWYCQENHFSDECPTYDTIENRKRQFKNQCYVCLRPGHNAKECRKARPCFHCGKDTHHRSLCPVKFKPVESSLNAGAQPFEAAKATVGTCNAEIHSLSDEHNTVLMQTAKVTVQNGKEKCEARILFDTGATRTFVHKNVADALQCKPVGHDQLSIAGFGAQTRTSKTLPRVELNVKLKDGTFLRISANVSEHISCTMERSPFDVKRYPGINDLHLAEPLATETAHVPIDILVGSDHYFDFVGLNHIQFSDGLTMLNTKLGFIPSGKVTQRNEAVLTNVMLAGAYTESEIEQPEFDLQRFWKLEQIGIAPETEKPDDETAYDHFQENVQFINGRYFVSWPWKAEKRDQLPENFELANGRLKSLIKRLTKTPEVLEKYHDTISQQLEMGVIEETTEDINENGNHHYIPHHCVVKPSSTTTKIRVVYDASAKTREENPSLNECMHHGPVLLPDLCGILLRFRLHPIAISGDIEKAFLQVGLHMVDRNVTRFLWLKDITKPPTVDNLVTYRFCRIPFGVVASPFLLSATINQHLKSENTNQAEAICLNTYVDNVLGGAESVDEAIKYYREVKQVFSNASMNLREWSTNSDEAMEQIPEIDRSNETPVKILGMEWDRVSDEMGLPRNYAENQEVNTKRQLLSVLASFYDPLGHYSPVIVRAKVLLQEIWKLKYTWDEVLPNVVLAKWKEIANDMTEVSKHRVPRFAKPADTSGAQYELHVFGDASKSAYGAVAYLRTIGESTSTRMIFAKSRIAPVKETTIPRLELLAATLGARVAKFLQREIPEEFSNIYLWSDSQCVLGWLKGEKSNLPTFVANRVQEITANSSLKFAYVESENNPADVLSRGSSANSLLRSSLWWEGPLWLQTCDWEMEKKCTQEHTVNTIIVGEGPVEQTVLATPAGINPTDYASFSKLVRITAYVTRFINRIRGKPATSLALSNTEISSAENQWIRYAQHAEHGEVFKALQKEQKNDLVSKHGLVLDDGIIRCQGRMGNATSQVKPIFLSGKSYISKLIIVDAHHRLLHGGTNATLVAVRRLYWVTRGRETVKRTVAQCKTCKRFDGGPYEMPVMPPYPKERVIGGSAPFTTTGVDYFGPVTVKTNANHVKVWVVLLTCLTTRAVHLELVMDMTTNTFLMAYRRFVARRGTPRKIISDNGRQFKLASSTFNVVWKSIAEYTDVLNYIASNGTQWSFITEFAPWMGGFYERMVQTVKRALRKSIGRSLLTLHEFETLLIECEAVVNARPLTYVSEDAEQVVITPAHFLCLNPNVGFPSVQVDIDDPNFNPNPNSSDTLVAQLKQGQVKLEQFWDIWRGEYLATLRERGSNQHRQRRVKHPDKPAVGDVVLVKDEHLPRAAWSLGRITELHNSADNQTRAVSLKTPNGRVIKRPLCLIYPIECQKAEAEDTVSGEADTTMNVESDDMQNVDIGTTADDVITHGIEPPASTEAVQPTEPASTCSRRPVRASAVASRNMLQQHIQDGNV